MLYLIIFREEDSTYIQQEIVLRQRYAIRDLMTHGFGKASPGFENSYCTSGMEGHYATRHHQYSRPFVSYGDKDECSTASLHSPHGQCPSSWHSQSECHSPVFPTSSLPYKSPSKDKQFMDVPESKKRRVEYGDMYYPQYPGTQPGSCLPNSYYGGYADNVKDAQTQASQDNIYRSCCERVAPTQFLMHLNGVGVSPQLTSTTLVFQGQLTAFETDPAFHQSPSSWTAYPHANYQTGQAGCQNSSQYLYAPNYDNSLYSNSMYQRSSHQPVANKSCSYSASTEPVSSCCSIEASSLTTTSSCTKANSLSLPGHTSRQPIMTSQTSQPDYSSKSSCSQPSDIPEVSRSSCVYQSPFYHATYKVMDVKKPVLTSCTQEMITSSCAPQMMTSEKKSKYELPAIGSFLEYLSTI